MAQFTSNVGQVSNAASATNLAIYVLTNLTTGDIASTKMISWGGSDASLVGQVTRWARVNNTPVTPTALGLVSSSPGITANSTCNTYATPAAQSTSASLFLQSWNSQGGGGVVVLPIGGEWRISGGALGTAYNQIGCGAFTGTTASANTSYGIQFEE